MHTKSLFKTYNIKTNLYLIILILLQLIMSLTALFFAFFSREAIDSIFDETTHQFMLSAILLSVLLIIQLLTSTLTPYMKALYTNRLENKLKKSLYHHILRSPLPDISHYHSGDLLNHLTTDMHYIADGTLDIIPKLTFYSVRFIGAFVLLYLIDPLLAIVLVSLGILLFLGSRLIAKPIKDKHKKFQEAESNVKGYIQESFLHLPLIKSFEAEEKMTHHLDDYQAIQHKTLEKRQRLNLLTSFGMTGFLVVGYGCAIILGALRLKEGLVTYGGLIAMIQLVGHLQSPFGGISHLVPRYYQMQSSIERIHNLDAMSTEPLTHHLLDFDKIICDDVSFAYDESDVIEHLNVVIEKGKTIQIKGDSGHGKTTLIKLLLGLYTPTSGRITYEKDHITYPISPATRSLFSYVPQGREIMSGTIKDILSFYHKTSEETMWHALKLCMLDNDIIALPLGLNTPLKEKGVGLSEGQLQRLMIARALIKDSPILLLDEVTSSLDFELEKEVLLNIKKLTDKTLIVISHRKLPDSFVDTYITF